jgi:hypothetical protein
VPFSFGFPNNRYEIRWIANGHKLPLLEVQGTEQGNNFVANRVTYRDIARLWPVGVPVVKAGNRFWHEAGSKRVHYLVEEPTPVELYDLQGRKVYSTTLLKGEQSIELENGLSGVYLLRVGALGQPISILKIVLP